MKVLLVHNQYGKRSGEEVELDCIRQLIEEHGHTTRSYLRSSETISQIPLGRVSQS